MPGSSQGTTVSFGGAAIGSLLQVKVDGGTAASTEVTSTTASVVGSGTSSRVRKQRDCTAIDPGGVSLRILGAAAFTEDDIGTVGAVAFTCDGGSLTAEAILEKFEIECSVGDFIRSSISFVFTGN